MTSSRSAGLVPSIFVLLATSLLPVGSAQTTTLDLPDDPPASRTPPATLLGEYPPPTEGRAVDDALNTGLAEYFTRYVATATLVKTADRSALCDFVISTQIPSATPSVTPALSSYISAAGIWLEDHGGFDTAKSLLSGDCARAVQPGDERARGDLDFVVGFGACYKLLAWDKRTVTSSASVATTSADSSPTGSSSGGGSESTSADSSSSPTGSPNETDAPTPPNAAGKAMANIFGILSLVAGVISLVW